MIKWLIASVSAVLVLGAGGAYAATQLTSESITQVCVNDINGMMRAATVCRDGEHAATIGGEAGGSVQATQEGAVVVAYNATSAGKTLPLTGVRVVGKCEAYTPPPPNPPGEIGLGRLLVTTTGTMTAFTVNTLAPGGVIEGSSLQTDPATSASGTGINYRVGPPFIVTSNGATATITFGVKVDAVERTCTYLWQAVEAPN